MTQPVLASPQPAYADPADVPVIQQQRKLTNTRRKQLIKAASRAADDPPPPPAPSDCCASNCDPCVRHLWKQEMLAWSQRWGNAAIHPSQKPDKPIHADSQPIKPIPGAFDW
ncbi:hypothetical protein ACQY0O_000136 [Thecaphora frezii]